MRNHNLQEELEKEVFVRMPPKKRWKVVLKIERVKKAGLHKPEEYWEGER